MANPFHNRALSIQGPATDIAPITPDDDTDLTEVAITLYAESGGTICFDTVRGERRSVVVTDFSFLPVGARRVCATGTTATGLHALVLK